MSKKPIELIAPLLNADDHSKAIAYLWQNWNNQRRGIIEEQKELRNFLFATDTSTTTQGQNTPWKNKTTLPKLTQIRDNLHSNYLAALFPNDDWLTWEAYSLEDSNKQKKVTIESYMRNKTRDGNFRLTASKLLYDYIDWGNAFCTVEFEKSTDETETIVEYIGPKLVRIAPEFIVFNPTAPSFRESPKIIRSIVTIGELKEKALSEPDNAYLQEAIPKLEAIRAYARQYGIEDNDIAEGFQIDGYGNLQEYYQSGNVEILEFWGDYHIPGTGELDRNKVITVVDRMFTIREDDIPSWLGEAPIYHVAWRIRPNNLWGMGPLNNLIGLQYRMDHLENSKADAYDLAIHPPLKIKGDVESFTWGPGCQVFLGDDGDVQEIIKNIQWVIQANAEIKQIEFTMEQYAGAPREAMGIRSPGEKTAFEVQSLENAAGRIFQEKITTFEIEIIEKALNAMLETSRRNMEIKDIVRVMDNDLGITLFQEITVDDIKAKGKLRPIGARHFAAQAQLLQNLVGLFNSSISQTLAPHLSGIKLAALIEDTLGISRYELFKPNAAVFEQQETQRLANQAKEDLVAESAV